MRRHRQTDFSGEIRIPVRASDTVFSIFWLSQVNLHMRCWTTLPAKLASLSNLSHFPNLVANFWVY